MAKEILLYRPMYDYTAESFLGQMESNKGESISVRMNCPGGDVYAAIGMITKFQEHKKGKTLQVDGQAKSGGYYFCCAADYVECNSASDFMVHRAAAPSWIENDPKQFTDEIKAQLTKVNVDLRLLAESKVDAATFKAVTGTTYDDLFSLEKRIDVNINAKQAKALGLVNKINPLTTEKKNEIMALASSNGIAAFATEPVIEAAVTINPIIQKDKIMTAAEFKAAHPAAYAEILAEGVKTENIRMGAWMAFDAIDHDAVIKALADTTQLVDMKVMADMTVKAMAGGTLNGIKKDNPPAVVTAPPAPAGTPEELAQAKETADFMATCAKDLNVTLATAPAVATAQA